LILTGLGADYGTTQENFVLTGKIYVLISGHFSPKGDGGDLKMVAPAFISY
jgi:hypothetical protein